MFAQLGNIKFELITYFNGLSETVSYNYVEHERIENKPILQYLGQNLKEENIKLNFHRSFCVPEEEILNLTEVADKATPLKFIKGNGDYVGIFVIEEIGQTVEQTGPEGDLISIQVEIKLKEYTGKIPDEDEEPKGFKKK
jgi:phage protein U